MAKPLTCLYCLCILSTWTIYTNSIPVHLIVYHMIWCPKQRTRILRGEIAQRLEQLVYEVAVEHNWQVLNLSIQPDHVHLFIRSNSYTLPNEQSRTSALIRG
jgi:REP element-mobilizing transposase RayT